MLVGNWRQEAAPERLETPLKTSFSLIVLGSLCLPTVAFGQDFQNDLGEAQSRDAKAIRADLTSQDGSIRRQACEDLQALGDGARDALPAVLEILEKDLDEDVQVEAVKVLGQLPQETSVTVPILIELIAQRTGSLQTNAVVVLGSLSEASENVLPCLIGLTRSKRSMVRVYAINALKSLGPKATPAIPALKKCFLDNHPMARRLAAQSLVAIGKDAIKPLAALTKHKDEDTKTLALSALIDLGGSKTLPTSELLNIYSTLVSVKERDMTNLTVGMLARILENDGRPDTINRILEAVSKTKDARGNSGLVAFLNSLSRYWAQNKFRIKNRKALIPMFKTLLRHKQVRVQQTTLRLVRYLEEDSEELIPILIELSKHKRLASTVSYSVRYLGKKAVPIYIKMLDQSTTKSMRLNIIRQIGYLRSEGRAALPLLKKLKKEEKDKSMIRYIDRSIRYIEMPTPTKRVRGKVIKKVPAIRRLPLRPNVKPQKLIPKKK